MKYYKAEFKKYSNKLQLKFLNDAKNELTKKFSGKKTIENKVKAPFLFLKSFNDKKV